MRSTSSAGGTGVLGDHRAPLVPPLRSIGGADTTENDGVSAAAASSARSYRLRQRSISDNPTSQSQPPPPLPPHASSVSSLALSSLPSDSATTSPLSSSRSRPRIILVGSDSTQTLVPPVAATTTATKPASTSSVYSLSKSGRRMPRTGTDSPTNAAPTTTFPSRRPSAPATVATPAYLPSSAPISDPMRALRVASRVGMSQYRVPLRVVAPKMNLQDRDQRSWRTEIDNFDDEDDDDDDAEHDVLRDYNASEESKETFKSSTHLSTSNFHSTPVPPTLSIPANQSIPNPNSPSQHAAAPHTPRSIAHGRPFSQPSFHPSPRTTSDSEIPHEFPSQHELAHSRLGHRFNSTASQLTEERAPLVRPQSHIGIGASSLHQTSYHSERDYINAMNEEHPQEDSNQNAHTNEAYSTEPPVGEENREVEANGTAADDDQDSQLAVDSANIQTLDYGSNSTRFMPAPPRTPGRESSSHSFHGIPPQPQLSLAPPKSPLVHHSPRTNPASALDTHQPRAPSASDYHEYGPSTAEGIRALDTRPDLPSFPLAMIDPACAPDTSNGANPRKSLKKKKIATVSTANLSKLSRAQLDRQISQEVAKMQANGPYHPLHVAADSLCNVLHSNATPFPFTDPLVFTPTSASVFNTSSDALARESIQFEYFHQHVMRLNALQKSDLTRVNTIKKSRSVFPMPRWNS